jgi:poly-gamma-glutamate synthesis protein (capsule biosynthesis protein)
VPFDTLEPRWKVLRLDGQSVLDKALALETYPLARRWIASGPEAALEALATQLGPDGRLTNRDVSRLAEIAMTGVTAPSRHTMEAIERAGDPLYPGRGVAELLSAADLTHISNEVAFLDRCPPGEVQGGALCGRPEYHALLAAVGADVIELTGNHMNDYGRAAFGDTIRAYYDAGLVTYGGGLTLAAAQRPAILEVAGNRIAFLGCNTVGPDFAFATAAEPGAAPCDYERLFAQLAELRERGEADVIVFTYQYLETQDGFYHYESTEPQRRDFQRMAAAGADIVSGSQAHQPQGFSFTPDGRFISYGLGNLFFDQMFSLGTRQGLIERHTVYAGRHISTELITTLLYDYAQPQITTEDERSALLYTLFAVSDW